jgi:prepilin-type N-terminal cleavage/methylation domain-containing protein
MRHTRQHGFTLTETLIVLAVLATVLVVVVQLGIQTSRMYALTHRRIDPQNALTLAMKKMDPDFRNAMAIATDSDGRKIELLQPQQDADGFNAVAPNTQNTKLLSLVPGDTISYFLGTCTYTSTGETKSWIATPNAEEGDTLFRIVGELAPNTSYQNAEIIVSGLVPGGAIFDYSVDKGYLIDPQTGKPLVNSETVASTTRIVRVGLTIPVRLVYPLGPGTHNETLWTQFSVRNMAISSQG